MLTQENLRGVWVSITMPWDADGNFDEATFRENVASLMRAFTASTPRVRPENSTPWISSSSSEWWMSLPTKRLAKCC